jgi:hypothetical protein
MQMNTKKDIDKRLLYVASPRPVISFEQSSLASQKITKTSGVKDDKYAGEDIQ